MNRLSRILAALIVFGICGNIFFYRTVSPLWFGLFFATYLLFVLFTARNVHKSNWILALVAAFGVGVVATRSTIFVQTSTVITLLAILFASWYISTRQDRSFTSLTQVLFSPFFALLTYIRTAFTLLAPNVIKNYYVRIVSLLSNTSQHSRMTSGIMGILIAVPVVTILVGMFAAADPIYYSYVQKIFSPSFLGQIPWRIILTGVMILTAIPFILPNTRQVSFAPGYWLSRLQIARELTIVMFSVALVIASFILIQWPYIFVSVAKETDLSAYGVNTYAEYVQKGFIELLRVSAFIYILLWLGLSALRHASQRPRFLFAIQLVVMAEFLIILLSIFRRVYLYQLYHGQTLIRVYGTFFLVWLTVLTLTLAARHFSKRFRWAYLEGAAMVVLFVIVGMWNVERYIALEHPPTVNKKVDHVYLSRMSADGIDGWIMAYNHANRILATYSKTEGELNAEARKEISYAYYILKKLTYNYQQLTVSQADPDEFEVYLGTVVDFQKDQMRKEIADLDVYQSTTDDNWAPQRVDEINRMLGMLDELEKSYTEKSTEKINEQLDVSVNKWIDLPRYEQYQSPTLHSLYDTSMYYPNEYYSQRNNTIVELYQSKQDSALESLFSYNTSARSAYEKMQSEIPLSQLHTMQRQYFALQERIEKQKDKNYDQDISLDSPLL